MRRLVIGLIAALAIVTVVRAYTLERPGVSLSPGLLELSDGTATVGFGFGLASGTADREGRRWGVLPLRIEYRSGDSTASLSLNGLSFLLGRGASIGQPVRVDRPMSGDVVSAGGPVTISSRVDGDVWTLGSDVTLGPSAEVTGSVVALGGTVSADPKARAAGGVHQLPALDLPLLAALGTRSAGILLALAREIGLFALETMLLLLLVLYLPKWVADLAGASTKRWRQAGLAILVAIVAVPVLALLLVVSVAGIFVLPFLALGIGVLAGAGAFGLCARLGDWLRKGGENTAATPLYLFTSGLLGLFIVKVPGLVGVLLGAVRGPGAATASDALRLAEVAIAALMLAWGFGTALAHARR